MKLLAILMISLMLGCEWRSTDAKDAPWFGFLVPMDASVSEINYQLQFKIPLVGPLTCVAKFDPPMPVSKGELVKVRANNSVEFVNNKIYSAKCVPNISSDDDLNYENCKIELAHSQQQWEMFRKERDECLRTAVCPLCNKRHNEN